MADVGEDPSQHHQHPVEFVEISARISPDKNISFNDPETQLLDSSTLLDEAPADAAEGESPSEEAPPVVGGNGPHENSSPKELTPGNSGDDAKYSGNPVEDSGNPAYPREPAEDDAASGEAGPFLEQSEASSSPVGGGEAQEQSIGRQTKELIPDNQVIYDDAPQDDDHLENKERIQQERKKKVVVRAPSLNEMDISESGFLSQIHAAIAELSAIGELIDDHQEAIKKMRDRRGKLHLLTTRLSALIESDSFSSTPPTTHGGVSSSLPDAQPPLPLAHAFRRATLLAKGDEDKQARLALRASNRQTLQRPSLRLHEPPKRSQTPTPPKRAEP
ncbi:hypothetical protein ACSSS7_003893 [Eimeria intestinalis]